MDQNLADAAAYALGDFINNPAKFHPNPNWNDRALGFLRTSTQQEQQVSKNNNKNKNKMSRDMKSVPDPKI